jgi:hypothetical protein
MAYKESLKKFESIAKSLNQANQSVKKVNTSINPDLKDSEQAVDDTARKRFYDNKEHFQQDKHYFYLTESEIRTELKELGIDEEIKESLLEHIFSELLVLRANAYKGVPFGTEEIIELRNKFKANLEKENVETLKMTFEIILSKPSERTLSDIMQDSLIEYLRDLISHSQNCDSRTIDNYKRLVEKTILESRRFGGNY